MSYITYTDDANSRIGVNTQITLGQEQLLIEDSLDFMRGKVDSLFQDNFWCAFAEEAVATVRHASDGAHGLADRIEGIDFVERLFRDLLAHRLVIPSQIDDEAQQGTLGLVAHLACQAPFFLWRLKQAEEKKVLCRGQTTLQEFE